MDTIRNLRFVFFKSNTNCLLSGRLYPNIEPNYNPSACGPEIPSVDQNTVTTAAALFPAASLQANQLVVPFQICLRNPQDFSCPGGYGPNCDQQCQGTSSYEDGTGRGDTVSDITFVDPDYNPIASSPECSYSVTSYDCNGPCAYPVLKINYGGNWSVCGFEVWRGNATKNLRVGRVMVTTPEYILVNGTVTLRNIVEYFNFTVPVPNGYFTILKVVLNCLPSLFRADFDGDGVAVFHYQPGDGDCDDGNFFIPAPEICNGFDDNCDGDIDEVHLLFISEGPPLINFGCREPVGSMQGTLRR